MATRASRLGWAIVVLFLLTSAAELLGELLWFQELGYAPVFWRILLTKLILLALSTLLVAAYLLANLLVLARQIDLPGTVHAAFHRDHFSPPPAPAISDRRLKTLLAALSIVGALLVGLIYAADSDGYLRFAFAQDFGETDPVSSVTTLASMSSCCRSWRSCRTPSPSWHFS